MGDNILIQQKKSTVKTPWDPKPFEFVAIQGLKVLGRVFHFEKKSWE